MTTKGTGMSEETLGFQAETARILDIVIHSLYSNKEIFLRELISNASDACDKLRYAAIASPDLLGDGDSEFKIRIVNDTERKVLIVEDNGIGMDRDDLIANLGTIAKSGTSDFLNNLSGDAKKDVELIGRFGVGFYASFMVAEAVEVLTRKAGDDTAYRWRSEGAGEYTIAEAEKPSRGTQIMLYLREDAAEYAEEQRIRHIVKTYSDHISFPVVLMKPPVEEAEAESVGHRESRQKWHCRRELQRGKSETEKYILNLFRTADRRDLNLFRTADRRQSLLSMRGESQLSWLPAL